MGNHCAMRPPWEQVQCVCGHGALKHGVHDTGTGCLALDERDGGASVAGCGCALDREDVLFAALRRAIAEICEHKDQRRTHRADMR